MSKYIFGFLADLNYVQLKYIEESARYDQELKDILDYFIANQRLPNKFKAVDPSLKVNITRLNKTKNRINNRFMEEQGGFKIGQKIIGCKNDKVKDIYNSEFYEISDIYDNKFKVKHIETTNDISDRYIPKSFFEPAFAATCYKYQGSTINEDYNIYDVNVIYRKSTRLNSSHGDESRMPCLV